VKVYVVVSDIRSSRFLNYDSLLVNVAKLVAANEDNSCNADTSLIIAIDEEHVNVFVVWSVARALNEFSEQRPFCVVSLIKQARDTFDIVWCDSTLP
jgi:hypothetical protein